MIFAGKENGHVNNWEKIFTKFGNTHFERYQINVFGNICNSPTPVLVTRSLLVFNLFCPSLKIITNCLWQWTWRFFVKVFIWNFYVWIFLMSCVASLGWGPSMLKFVNYQCGQECSCRFMANFWEKLQYTTSQKRKTGWRIDFIITYTTILT